MELPKYFEPILWSYNFSAIDPERDKKTIIINAINYGDLEHWRWLMRQYGKDVIKDVLEHIPVTEIRPRAMRLATLIFSLQHVNHVSRSAQ